MRRFNLFLFVLVFMLLLAPSVSALEFDEGDSYDISTFADVSYSDYVDFYFLKQPVNFRGAVGAIASFSVLVNRSDVTYQWQYRSGPNSSWASTTISGNRTDTLSPPISAVRDGFQYRCIVTDSSGRSIASSPASLFVSSDSDISIPSYVTSMFTNVLVNLVYWFELVLSESGFTGLYLGAAFLFFLSKYLLQPLFGSAGSDKARKVDDE